MMKKSNSYIQINIYDHSMEDLKIKNIDLSYILGRAGFQCYVILDVPFASRNLEHVFSSSYGHTASIYEQEESYRCSTPLGTPPHPNFFLSAVPLAEKSTMLLQNTTLQVGNLEHDFCSVDMSVVETVEAMLLKLHEQELSILAEKLYDDGSLSDVTISNIQNLYGSSSQSILDNSIPRLNVSPASDNILLGNGSVDSISNCDGNINKVLHSSLEDCSVHTSWEENINCDEEKVAPADSICDILTDAGEIEHESLEGTRSNNSIVSNLSYSVFLNRPSSSAREMDKASDDTSHRQGQSASNPISPTVSYVDHGEPFFNLSVGQDNDKWFTCSGSSDDSYSEEDKSRTNGKTQQKMTRKQKKNKERQRIRRQMLKLQCSFAGCQAVVRYRRSRGSRSIKSHLRCHTKALTVTCPICMARCADNRILKKHHIACHTELRYRGPQPNGDEFLELKRMLRICFPYCRELFRPWIIY